MKMGKKLCFRVLTTLAFLPAVYVLEANSTAATSVRDVDFKNFDYPFVSSELVLVPDKIRWISPASEQQIVRVQNGRYTFPCDTDGPCPLLTLDNVTYGHLDGLPGTCAFVVVGYHPGGSATWQYVYVIVERREKPEVVASLETGSRAYGGLRGLETNRGDLVLVVNDPEKRFGDCCSRGTITYRFRWTQGSFHQVGELVYKDDDGQPQ